MSISVGMFTLAVLSTSDTRSVLTRRARFPDLLVVSRLFFFCFCFFHSCFRIGIVYDCFYALTINASVRAATLDQPRRIAPYVLGAVAVKKTSDNCIR